MSGFIVFCSFLSGHCLSKQERGTWPQEIFENFVGGAQTWVLLLKNYVNWVLLWCTPDYIRHTLLIKLLPVINTVISRCWKFFLSSAAMAMSFYATFLARGIVSIGTFKWLLPSLSSAFPTRPHLRSYTLHSTCDKKISRDNFTYFKTINKKHKMYACLLLDFKALSIVIDFVVRLLGKV